jgi:hypothetical protein
MLGHCCAAANTEFNLAREESRETSIEADRNRSPLTASRPAVGDKHKHLMR